jgi:hypothetical protein
MFVRYVCLHTFCHRKGKATLYNAK